MAARLVEKLHLMDVKTPPRGAQGKPKSISTADCLMSALAIFKLKFPSLLQFEERREEKVIKRNLKNLFQLERVPCDTYMRECLDFLNPMEIRPAFTTVFSAMQRGKALEQYRFIEGKYLMLSDGTGYFSSQAIHCDNCCEKHHKDGKITYYHQFLGAVIAHPDYQEVIPICPEPIMREDGTQKNDCERNAAVRLLKDFRREHPHLPVIWVEDALAANGPHIKLLKELNIGFITVVKPEGNKALFDWMAAFDWDTASQDKDNYGEFTHIDKAKRRHKFRYVNDVPLNDSHADLLVNFLEYWELDPAGKVLYHNTWITDIKITPALAMDIARGGRTRWHIENEAFNTLKNQGYQFEHSYGHGKKNLSTLFAMLMMLAFLIDQCEQISCGLFQDALKHLKSKKTRLWERVRGFFTFHIIPSWEDLYRAIVMGCHSFASVLDTC
jgi:hypothetical protein